MNEQDADILKRLEALSKKMGTLAERAVANEQKERALYARKFAEGFGMMVAQDKMIFGLEPWHALGAQPLSAAGEMLLRVNDFNGNPLSPYPAVMTLYHNGFTEALDTIIALRALSEFRKGSEKQISINISCRSLKDKDFIEALVKRLEGMKISGSEKIILEIHESNAVIELDKKFMKLLKKLGVQFAMDDVGVSINDIFRLSAFEGVADYIKLDRASVQAHPEDPRALGKILALAKSHLPGIAMVAEGIQSADHAREIMKLYPDVKYVQGMNLPERAEFIKAWREKKET